MLVRESVTSPTSYASVRCLNQLTEKVVDNCLRLQCSVSNSLNPQSYHIYHEPALNQKVAFLEIKSVKNRWLIYAVARKWTF